MVNKFFAFLTLALTSCMPALAQAQEAPQQDALEHGSTPVPPEETSEIFRRVEGYDHSVAGRLSDARTFSIADYWDRSPNLAEQLGLTQEQKRLVRQSLKKRAAARTEAEAEAVHSFRVCADDAKTSKEKKITKALATYASREEVSESQLSDDIEEILLPKQSKALVLYLIKCDQFRFADLDLVARTMELSDKQRSLFRKWVDEIESKIQATLKEKGRFEVISSRKLSRLEMTAKRSLTRSQLEFYWQAIGRLKQGESTQAYLAKLSLRDRSAMMTKYPALHSDDSK